MTESEVQRPGRERAAANDGENHGPLAQRGQAPQDEPPAKVATAQKRLHRFFEIAILVKGIDGVLETFGGLLLLFVPLRSLNDMVAFVIDKELSTDPADWVVDLLSRASAVVSTDTKRFASAYLISHGLVKLLLVFALWREIRAAFPLALAFMALFIFYQLDRYMHTRSIWLLVFASIDIAVSWLVWREYRAIRVPR